jgi:IS5 family transposase
MNTPGSEALQPEVIAPEEFLEKVGGLIDWTTLAPILDAVAERTGRKLPESSVKISLLKLWYDLADTLSEFSVLDRLSFRRFVGFAGDASSTDVEILNELRDGIWSESHDIRPVLDAVEQQLRAKGYSVQPGYVAEPAIVPCTEGALPVVHSTTTAVPQPGELGLMVEAMAAKAPAKARMPTGPQTRPEESSERVVSLAEARAEAGRVQAGDETQLRNVRVRAQIQWPWGQRSDLTDVLHIGRDFSYSPFARELTPYTHVSRRHAELVVHGDGVWIKDLGSRNGTFVNDDAVPKGQAFLIDGDSIVRFGPLLAVSVKILE